MCGTHERGFHFSSGLEEEIGLHYNLMRYYEPKAGRFVNQDIRWEQFEMEPKIDFKDGIITYENLFWLFNNTNELINKLEFEEDLLQVQFFNEKYILDVGWYPHIGRNGKFKVYVIKNSDWQNPLFIKSDNTINDLITTIKQGIKCIYAHEHIQQ